MNKTIKRNHSSITKRIMRRYMVYWFILLAAFFLTLFLSGLIMKQFYWDAYDPFYTFFKVLEYLSPYIIFAGMIIGGLILMHHAIRKSLEYVDITLDGAKKLSEPEPLIIELPPELVDVQNELNLVRDHIYQNIATAKEAKQRKNDLVMYLAHDLKTPLASVIGYLNLLKDADDLSEDTRRKYLDITLQKSERLENLINEFFEIARFNLSDVTLDYQTIDLTRMLEQTVYEFQPMFQEKGLSCDLKIKEPIIIECDPYQLQRVFDNLLRNAVTYSYHHSEITIELSEDDRKPNVVTLEFINVGKTIEKEKLERIFEQFYRADPSLSSTGGAGLGLAIAKQIVELHNGTISASSADEKTIFSVTLPLV